MVDRYAGTRLGRQELTEVRQWWYGRRPGPIACRLRRRRGSRRWQDDREPVDQPLDDLVHGAGLREADLKDTLEASHRGDGSRLRPVHA